MEETKEQQVGTTVSTVTSKTIEINDPLKIVGELRVNSKEDDFTTDVSDPLTGAHKFLAHDGYKSRKFWFTVGLSLAACFLVYFQAIDGEVWKSLEETIFCGYVLGNLGEKITSNSLVKNIFGKVAAKMDADEDGKENK